MPIPAGDADFTELRQKLRLRDNVAAVLFIVGGKNFSGDCWVEGPELVQNGETVLEIPFTKHADRISDTEMWVGRDLVTRNWPLWGLSVNGERFFKGEEFDRASPVADFYIPLPNDTKASDKLELALLERPNVADFPYNVKRLEIIEQPIDDLVLISQPKYIPVDERFGILMETHKPDLEVSISTPDTINAVDEKLTLAKPGLHVFEFFAKETGPPFLSMVRFPQAGRADA